MDGRMAGRAVLISEDRLIVERRHVRGELVSDAAVTFETQLPYRASLQHLRVRRPMRGVARRASLYL